jgi:hypothetical protein
MKPKYVLTTKDDIETSLRNRAKKILGITCAGTQIASDTASAWK